MGGFCCHADGFRQSGVGVDGEADIFHVRAHFNRMTHFGDQFTGIGADRSAADDASTGLVE